MTLTITETDTWVGFDDYDTNIYQGEPLGPWLVSIYGITQNEDGTASSNCQDVRLEFLIPTYEKELLDALERLENACEHGTVEEQTYACKNARAVIARARGVS